MELIGNTGIIEQINIAIISARERNRSIPHLLMTGAAGCGKTSTAKYIAKATNCKLLSVAPDSLKDRNTILPIVNQFDTSGYNNFGSKIEGEPRRPSILFIDEVHNLPLSAQEHIGILMEEWYISVNADKAKLADKHVIEQEKKRARGEEVGAIQWSPQFTLIGATTNDGKLSKPFRDRFKLRFVFSPYTLKESVEIVQTHAERLKVKIDTEAALEIAQRGRGVPRVLVTLLERCCDMSITTKSDTITTDITYLTFKLVEIDKTGLTATDISILKKLYKSEDAVGIDNLAIQLNESSSVLSNTIEPYLIQRGLIIRTSKGRKITRKGRMYLLDNGHQVVKREKYDIPIGYERRM